MRKIIVNTLLEQEQSTSAGKYLIFALAEEEYGLNILKVREIISMSEITSIPKAPEYVKGVINLRGKVIPVIDLRLKFDLEEAPYTDDLKEFLLWLKQQLKQSN